MTERKHRRRPYQARVEYRAVQAEVEGKLAAGHSRRMIHEALVEAGKMTIGYAAFCDYVRGKGERKHGKKKRLSQVSQETKKDQGSRQSGGFKWADKSEPFKLEKTPPLSELV